MNIRERIATGFGDLVASRLFFPVELKDPDGVEYKLKGEILYDKDAIDPETGDLIVVQETFISIFKEHLTRIPKAGERWVIKFPLNPAAQTVLSTFVLNSDKAPVDGGSIGFIKLFPQELEQS
jgi:hypothetical protein